jgi:uncharacterized Zn finger protein (UPF0148 family)
MLVAYCNRCKWNELQGSGKVIDGKCPYCGSSEVYVSEYDEIP